MSLVSLAQSIAKKSSSGQAALLWVLNQIDMNKLTAFVSWLENATDVDSKCVLLEYHYTPWNDVRAGVPDISDRLPGTDLLVHSALSSPEFWRLATKYITGSNPRAQLYVRRKIDYSTNKPTPHTRQLVLMFAKVVQEPLNQSEVSSIY
jgi:hypothetical protein